MSTTHPSQNTLPGRRGRRAQRMQLSGRDLELLEFIAAHRFVQKDHIADWLSTGRSVTYHCVGRLVSAGLVRHERIFHAQPGIYTITNGGLEVINSPLRRPSVDLRLYRHEAAVPALWLAARAGAFGSAYRILTERQIINHDQTPGGDEEGVEGVPLGGYDRSGRPRLHSPDLMVGTASGRRTAVELELSLKGRRRVDEILLAYERDDTIRRVIYITDQRAVADAVERSASLLAPNKITVLKVTLPLTTQAVIDAAEAGLGIWGLLS